MAHQRKSELNRMQQDGVVPETPYGLPSDDVHPDAEPHPGTTPPGAPERGTKLNPNASVDWGNLPGEDVETPDEGLKEAPKGAVAAGGLKRYMGSQNLTED